MDLISKPIELVGLLLLLLCTQAVGLQLRRGRDYSSSSTGFRCIEEERDALLDFKSGLDDSGNRLSSWVAEDDDCCQWRGVRCNNRTGRVDRLVLRGPPQDRFGFGIGFGFGETTNMLGGEIRPSLLVLTHLKHLDLSQNDFYEMTGIPVFLGSFKELRYLNLSRAGFNGRVPPELGNLSTLQHLDLSYNYHFSTRGHVVISVNLHVEDTRWLSRLTSLRHLDMSSVLLQKASSSSWLHALNMLPSILEIRLSQCELDGPLPSSLPHNNFTSLSILDLSWNNINSTIPGWLCNLTSLAYLDLSYNQFYGHIPAALENVIFLEHLDLMYNNFDGPIPAALGNMTPLEYLGLSFTGYIHVREISKSLVNLCNLSTFGLSGLGVSGYMNDLQEVFSAGCMRNTLNTLQLSETNLTGILPDWLGGLRNLVNLYMSENQLYGSIPSSLGNLVSLQILYLSENKLTGSIPASLGNLVSLQRLNLYGNKLTGSILASLGNLVSLQGLKLYGNKLTGSIPASLGNLASLQRLYLYGNKLTGSIPASLGNLVSLQGLDLSNNKLNGSVPMTLGLLSNLTDLDLGSNNLEGVILEAHFMNLGKLNTIDISGNPLLTLRVSSDWNPPFRLDSINMGSCHLGPQFPAWIRTQENYSELNMSYARISDSMPDWFWNISTQVTMVDLSHNNIDGKMQSWNAEYVQVLDLSHNLFSGPIPPSMGEAMPNLEYFSVSTNRINGTIQLSICKATQLTALDLSNNFLSGELPKCLENLPFLTVFDLSNNSLSGELPRSICTLSNLQSLHLGSNNLSGEVPFALSNWTNLVALDLSNNRFNGSIPPGIGQSLSSLMFLSLHSNLLSGSIPSQLSNLRELQVLDLSHNQLSGFIPQSFGDFNAMKFDHKINYTFISILQYNQENLMLNMKGGELLYDWRLLSIVVTIDLSDNQLSGSVPKELGNLIGLETLDLSGNQLSGEIIQELGELWHLETLDLSNNKFSGRIPSSFSTMYSLSHLNLSYNNLTGRIPSGEQLQTLNDPSIYIGNDGLCGPPLMKQCPEDETPGYSTNEDTEESDEIVWLYSGMAPGYVVGLLAFFGLLALKRKWRIAYFRFIDNTYDTFYVAIVVNMNKLKRQMRKIGSHGLNRRN